MTCYSCGAELTKKNGSWEHVIPNALGGTLGSYNLLCRECNSFLGSSVDHELISQIGFIGRIIGVKRDRKKADDSTEMVTKSGKKVVVGKRLSTKPKMIIELPDRSEPIVIYAKDEADLERQKSKKIKELSKKYKDFRYEENLEYHTEERFFFKDHLSQTIGEAGRGGHGYVGAMTKIALNFLLLSEPKAQYSSDIVSLITLQSNLNQSTFFYYPSHYAPYVPKAGEVSHVLYVKGDPSLKLVYGYVELFNTESCIVLFDSGYSGREFEHTYCWNLINNEVQEADVKIKMIRQHFLDWKLFSQSHAHERNHERKHIELEKKLEALQ